MKRTDAELVSLYGVCHLCHAPMDHRVFRHTDEDGYERGWSTRFCTVEPLEHRYDIYLLDEWEREALRSIKSE